MSIAVVSSKGQLVIPKEMRDILSIKAGQKVKADLEMALSLEQLKVGISLMNSKATQGKPIGYLAPEDWNQTLSLMKQYMGLETNMNADAFYTNQFVPNAPKT
jgi:NitT/TauT family transport system substrate-binding protein